MKMVCLFCRVSPRATIMRKPEADGTFPDLATKENW